MILFLIIVNHAEEKDGYEKAILWAKDKLKEDIDKIPVDEYKYVEFILS
jgi:hypothetical protein